MSQLMLYQALINRTTLRGAPRTGLDFSLQDRYTTWNPGPGKALPRTCHPRPPQACTVGYPAIGGADRARTRSQELKRVISLTGVESEVTSVAVIRLAANRCIHMRHSGYVTQTIVHLFSTELSLTFL